MVKSQKKRVRRPLHEAQILDAARRVFVRRGVAAARTQEIADEAGVNKALLHYYYRSKENLADAVFLEAARHLFPPMVATFVSGLPLREKLLRAIQLQTDAATANPFLPGFVMCELRTDAARLTRLLHAVLPVETAQQQLVAALQADLDAEAAAGRLRPTQAETFLVAFLSLAVFPFAGSHMLNTLLGLDAAALDRLAAWRRAELADTLLRAFAP